MLNRSDCRCSCHTNDAIVHIAPCCQPAPSLIEADGVIHSHHYYDFDRNKPFPTHCCEKDHDADGNCHIHSAPGVFRNQVFNERKA